MDALTHHLCYNHFFYQRDKNAALLFIYKTTEIVIADEEIDTFTIPMFCQSQVLYFVICFLKYLNTSLFANKEHKSTF